MHTVQTQKDAEITHGNLDDLKTKKAVWVDFVSPTDQELSDLATHTDIDPKQIREWLAGKRRPEAINFQNYSVLIFLAAIERIQKNKKTFNTKPCVVLVSNDRNDFITIHETPLRAIDEMNAYSPRHKREMFAQHASFLLFTYVNEMVEHYYDALELINETVEEVEGIAMNSVRSKTLIEKTHGAKKSLIYFHRALAANRDVIATIEHEHLEFIDEKMVRDFRILSSNITQLIEINSMYREVLNTSMEIHLNVISNSLNETMKKVTSWAAIILIPSLISGIFGMNFRHFGMFEWLYGVPAALGMMVGSVVILYWYFKTKDWL